MKTGPKPFRISEYSFLDKNYTFSEIKQFAKDKLTSRAKISFKCKECGKIETIALDRFLKYNDVLCRTCNSKLNIDYEEAVRQRILHSKETIKEKYGVNNAWQCPNSTEKRINATRTLESKKKKGRLKASPLFIHQALLCLLNYQLSPAFLVGKFQIVLLILLSFYLILQFFHP